MNEDFLPAIWPEDKLPPEAKEYSKCEVCTSKSRVIWGEGNPKAPIIIILDNPGAREDREGIEYTCGTRRTLQLALIEANLPIDNVYITYLLKCRPLRRYNKEEARAFSMPYLVNQIKSIDPRYLICLGDVVVQNMFNDSEAHVKDLRGKWHYILDCPTIVSYHPLAVRRRPNLKKFFISDFMMLGSRYDTEKPTLN